MNVGGQAWTPTLAEAVNGAYTPFATRRVEVVGSSPAWRNWPKLKGAIRAVVAIAVSTVPCTSTAVRP